MASLIVKPAVLRRARLAMRPCMHCRHYAAESTPPSLLSKLRSDLKTAMKEKDKDRLNVLRSLLAEVTNAAKTSSPIQSDMQVLSLLRKRSAAAKNASSEFAAAGRDDLVEQENRQAHIIEEYAGGVKTMGESEIGEAVNKVVDALKTASEKLNMGDVLKKLLGPGGSLDGKNVEKSEVARLVKKALGQ
ncbi:GatB/YqeY domain-containing protein [Acrodontium crateriforme]|uniref:Altered inheritance of mitochondria protein 41 n=1 Tax=Acrodontium crateriforme TaxID=150365 RepID=A0AAQ3M053_9PEZI|nr:GatB/YqeY domain-containing protein [Acrodontium crateriforme]